MPPALPIAICATLALVVALIRAWGIVFVGKTMAGLTIVHDDRRVMRERIRVLEVAGTYQSATYLDDRWAEPVFEYHRLFDHAFDPWAATMASPRSAAVLGGGGYALPKHLVAHHSELANIDVVEIDPVIERIARRHFFLDRLEQTYHAESTGRLKLYVDDAFEWLESCDRRFDIIINDCFLALTPEFSLLVHDGAELMRDHLNENGVYLANVVSAISGPDAATLYVTAEALRAYFSHVWIYSCGLSDPFTSDNNIVIATDAPHAFVGAWEWPNLPKEA